MDRHTAVVQDMHNLPGRRSDAHEEDRRGIVQSGRTMSPPSPDEIIEETLLTQCNSPTGKSPTRFVRRCAWRVRRPCRTSTHQHPFHPREQAKERKRPPGAQRTYISIGNVVGEVDVDDGESSLDGPFAVPSQSIILPTVKRLNIHQGAMLLWHDLPIPHRPGARRWDLARSGDGNFPLVSPKLKSIVAGRSVRLTGHERK